MRVFADTQSSHKGQPTFYAPYVFPCNCLLSKNKIVSLHRLRSLVKDRKRCFDLWNRQNFIRHIQSTETAPKWAACCVYVGVCRYLKVAWWAALLLPYWLHNTPNVITEKKFLVFGRVLPIERLCSTRFSANYIFFFSHIVLLSYYYNHILCHYYICILCNYQICIISYFVVLIFFIYTIAILV